MGFSFNSVQSDITGEFLTVRSAADISGYNEQYIRRLLREGVFMSTRIGQIWMINQDSFSEYLDNAKQSKDKRIGSQV